MISLPRYDAFRAARQCKNPICSLIAEILVWRSESEILGKQLRSLNKASVRFKSHIAAIMGLVEMFSL